LIVFDTTVLVYAVGQDHPLRAPCRDLVAAVADHQLGAMTTVEVVQEFAHLRARRRPRSEAVQDAVGFATLLAPLFRPDRSDLTRGLEIFERHARLDAFDAVLAAVVLGTDHLTGIVSADRAFGTVPGLRWIDPAGDDVVARAIASG
jgi:predicted nucleic acid-binding protein